MALRAKTPEKDEKRLKLLLYGEAGVGKTTAAMQFPRAYIIDAERGTAHYDEKARAQGSVIFGTTDIREVVQEVKSLLTEKHDYRTLVLDPVTPLYQDLLDRAEARVGSDFGRHYGEANKEMKRLANLLMALDMNVIMTCHAKTEYGPKLEKLGITFDGWKRLDYLFDLVLRLERKSRGSQERVATVVKTRLATFPDQESFTWTYEEFSKRQGATLEREAKQVTLATDAQVAEIARLSELLKLPEETLERWRSKANAETWADFPADALEKCIEYCRKTINGNGGEK